MEMDAPMGSRPRDPLNDFEQLRDSLATAETLIAQSKRLVAELEIILQQRGRVRNRTSTGAQQFWLIDPLTRASHQTLRHKTNR